MASPKKKRMRAGQGDCPVHATYEDLMLACLERGGETLETGRYLISYKEGAVSEGLKALKQQHFRMADARDFKNQAVVFGDLGDAEVLLFPEIGVALVGGGAMQQRGLNVQDASLAEGPIEAIEPEYFAFADNSEYLRGFVSAAETIARDLGTDRGGFEEVDAQVLGATWGLVRCKVPPGSRTGSGITVAVLDTGLDLGHPDFAGRTIVSRSFVGQPVQDLNGHGTHTTGTACGPRSPAGTTPRYGIAHRARIFTGKVLTNAGGGTSAGVLAGMNWAIANGCQVISMSLGAPRNRPWYMQFAHRSVHPGTLR